MADIPENVDLNWIGRRLVALQDDFRAMRGDMDMLIRMTVRLDNTVNALREDVRALWSSQRDLRQRIEAVEGRDR
jgi:hypothetical protein